MLPAGFWWWRWFCFGGGHRVFGTYSFYLRINVRFFLFYFLKGIKNIATYRILEAEGVLWQLLCYRIFILFCKLKITTIAKYFYLMCLTFRVSEAELVLWRLLLCCRHYSKQEKYFCSKINWLKQIYYYLPAWFWRRWGFCDSCCAIGSLFYFVNWKLPKFPNFLFLTYFPGFGGGGGLLQILISFKFIDWVSSKKNKK